MKRFNKIRSKKGFTLLEVLLATAILVIVSSMLMEGFITSMGYSYNSSVYSRSASYNSQLCVSQLAKWSMYADNVASYNKSTGKTVKLDAAYENVGHYADASSAQRSVLYFDAGDTGTSLGNIKVALYKKSSVGITANNLSGFTNEKAVDTETDKVADNRTMLFYYPTNNGSGSHYGNTHLYMESGVKVWCWEEVDAEGKVLAVHKIT